VTREKEKDTFERIGKEKSVRGAEKEGERGKRKR